MVTVGLLFAWEVLPPEVGVLAVEESGLQFEVGALGILRVFRVLGILGVFEVFGVEFSGKSKTKTKKIRFWLKHKIGILNQLLMG